MALMLPTDVKISIDCKFQAHNVRKTKDRDVLVKCSLSRYSLHMILKVIIVIYTFCFLVRKCSIDLLSPFISDLEGFSIWMQIV